MNDDRVLEAAKNDGVQLLAGDAEFIQRRLVDGLDGLAGAISELFRSRGALLRFALKIANAEDVPDAIRAEAQQALQDAVLR